MSKLAILDILEECDRMNIGVPEGVPVTDEIEAEFAYRMGYIGEED